MKINMIQMGIALLSAAALVASAMLFKEGFFKEMSFYLFLAVGSTNVLLLHKLSKGGRKSCHLNCVPQ